MPSRLQTSVMNTAHNYQVARDNSGKVNYEAYKNCRGFITENGLDFPVVISSARYRYGHLDLLVTPENGAGTRWVQRTNIRLENDPAEVAV